MSHPSRLPRSLGDMGMCVQADAANLLSATIESSNRDGFYFDFPGDLLSGIVEAARLPAAEPASHEAMRLLCLITQQFSAASYPDRTSGKHEQRRGSAADPSASSSNGVGPAGCDTGSGVSNASLVRAHLARLGAAEVAFAHLQHFPQSVAPGGSHDAPRLTRGFIARFLCWVCKAPEVFQDLQDRGLLESLDHLLRSSEGDERAHTVLAVARLITRHTEAAACLRMLGAVTPLVEVLKVCPGPIQLLAVSRFNATLQVALFAAFWSCSLVSPRVHMARQ